MIEPDLFANDLGFIEGPAWDPDGTLSLVSIDRGCVYRLDGFSGAVLAEASTAGGPNGLVLGQSAAYIAQNGGIFGASGTAPGGVQAVRGGDVSYVSTDGFVAPNDICFLADGRLIVTDPETDAALQEPLPGRVLACDPSTGASEVLLSELLCPNGLAVDADDRFLYLTQSYARTVERYRIEDGGLVREAVVCEVDNGRPDGMAIDRDGNFWVCVPASGGVNVYDASGRSIERVECGEGSLTTNVCFGGPELTQIFITAAGRGSVLTLPAPVAGLALHPFRGAEVSR